MKFALLRTISVFSLAASLAACGAGAVDEQAAQSASMQTGVAVTSAGVSAAATGVTSASGTTSANASSKAAAGATAVPVASTAGAGTPQADCAADGCDSPRIIDGNAEAWRYAAMQRAGDDSAAS